MRKNVLSVTISNQTWERMQQYRKVMNLSALTEKALIYFLDAAEKNPNNLEFFKNKHNLVPVDVRLSTLEEDNAELHQLIDVIDSRISTIEDRFSDYLNS